VKRRQKTKCSRRNESLITEVLLTPDGRILVHNLTATFAELLSELDPEDQYILSRIVRPK